MRSAILFGLLLLATPLLAPSPAAAQQCCYPGAVQGVPNSGLPAVKFEASKAIATALFAVESLAIAMSNLAELVAKFHLKHQQRFALLAPEPAFGVQLVRFQHL